jgi:sugar/nucleoside kinase (ribokinase family)
VVGDLIYDLLARVEKVSFGADTFAPIRAAAGGSGANTAAWLAHAGVETHFVGRIGDDPFGDFLAAEFARAGVAPHLARDPELSTGKVFVLVDSAGERTMITDRGAGENLRPSDLPNTLFRSGAHLHLSGYTLSGGTRRDTALEALRLAREAEMTVSVDPSSAPLLKDIGPESFLRWTAGADLCFPNLEEGSLLAGTKDPDSILQTLREHYPAAVLKLGAGGAVYSGHDGTSRLPSKPARVVDTTGAGDALCAGFLAAWVAGSAPADALYGGMELAARAVGRMGARPRL